MQKLQQRQALKKMFQSVLPCKEQSKHKNAPHNPKMFQSVLPCKEQLEYGQSFAQ
ncbi:hypothetical protein BLGI_4750 [Brevibacillus laterosporus GI-9]|nr:hypothetical protein BLGI_4750 [Brevibacillus laterosporus GI-9]